MTAPLRYIAQAFAVTVAAVLIGAYPTRELAGPEGLPAMMAGCLIGLVSSLAGAGPIVALGAKGTDSARLVGVLLSTVLRLFTAALLGAAAVWTGRFATPPLLIWIALSYMANLVVEVRYAIRLFPRNVEK